MDNWLVYDIFVHHNLFEWVLKVMPLEWFGIFKEYEIGNDYFCNITKGEYMQIWLRLVLLAFHTQSFVIDVDWAL